MGELIEEDINNTGVKGSKKQFNITKMSATLEPGSVNNVGTWESSPKLRQVLTALIKASCRCASRRSICFFFWVVCSSPTFVRESRFVYSVDISVCIHCLSVFYLHIRIEPIGLEPPMFGTFR